MYLFVGIVVGVLVVLYSGRAAGRRAQPGRRRSAAPSGRVVRSLASMAAVADLRGPAPAGTIHRAAVTLNGGVAWVVYGAHARHRRHLAGRRPRPWRRGWWGCSGSCCRATGSLPRCRTSPRRSGRCCPGRATYFGLLAIAQNDLDAGLASLTKAAALALAIAIGVNLGSEISRLFLQGAGRGRGRTPRGQADARLLAAGACGLDRFCGTATAGCPWLVAPTRRSRRPTQPRAPEAGRGTWLSVLRVVLALVALLVLVRGVLVALGVLLGVRLLLGLLVAVACWPCCWYPGRTAAGSPGCRTGWTLVAIALVAIALVGVVRLLLGLGRRDAAELGRRVVHHRGGGGLLGLLAAGSSSPSLALQELDHDRDHRDAARSGPASPRCSC